ncbi:MAG: hypothetical protein KDA85_21365, partial [Planctomycetaceae bacterium]|nr:hypothetical protein [Planctomycetaceae bacterium]
MTHADLHPATIDPASFRDRTARVFVDGGNVYRQLQTAALTDWQQLQTSGLADQLITAKKLIGTQRMTDDAAPPLPEAGTTHGSTAVLKHDRIPLITYPWEWSFQMLKDAGLLQLELMESALQHGMILKDATPFNIQFHDCQPVFIDTASFTAIRPGRPWEGYQQFCRMFLFPLMLQAWHDIDFQSALRGLQGISPTAMSRSLSWRDLFRPGALTHVFLHARLSASRGPQRQIPESLQASGFSQELIL